MKKKIYVSPRIETCEMTMERQYLFLAGSYNEQLLNEEVNGDAALGQGRRSSWGNLWEE